MKMGVGDGRSHRGSRVYGDKSVIGTRKNDRWRAYSTQHRAYIDLCEGSPPQFGRRRAGYRPLQLSEHLPDPREVGHLTEIQLCQGAFAPVPVNLIDLRFDFTRSETPREVGKLLGETRCRAIEAKRMNPIRIGGREQETYRASLAGPQDGWPGFTDPIDHCPEIIDTLIEGEDVRRGVG
jgi:hypothetical protein